MTKVADSALCETCGRPLPVDARFCPKCGLAVAEPDLLLDPLGIDIESSEAATENGGRVGSWQSEKRTVATVGALVVLLVAWFMIRTPRTTLDGIADNLAGAPPAEDTESISSAAPSVDEVDFAPVQLSRSGGSAPLDEPMEADVYLGFPTDLVKIALDTGAVTTFDVDGEPLAVWGDELLLQTIDGIVRVPLADPAGQGEPVYDIPENRSAEFSDVGLVDDQLVVTNHPDDEDRSYVVDIVDLGTGRVRSTLVAEPGFAERGFAWVPGGGTFDVTGDEVTKVFDGLAFAAGPTMGIGQSCKTPNDCENTLFDRRTGRPRTDLMVPEVNDLWSVQFLPGSERFVILAEPQETVSGSSRARFFDVADGVYLPAGLLVPGQQAYDFEVLGHFTVGRDRFVIRGSNGAIRIQDVIEHRGWKLELPELDVRLPGETNRVFFVER